MHCLSSTFKRNYGNQAIVQTTHKCGMQFRQNAIKLKCKSAISNHSNATAAKSTSLELQHHLTAEIQAPASDY